MSNPIAENQKTVPVIKDPVPAKSGGTAENNAPKVFGRNIDTVESKHLAPYTVFVFDSLGEKKEPATQEDIDCIKERFDINNFKNINVIPSKKSIKWYENNTIQGYRQHDALECKTFTPEGGELFLSSRNSGVQIPPGALSENVLVVIGGGTGTKANPNDVSDDEESEDEGISEPRHRDVTPYFFMLPDKYPLNKEAAVFLKNLAPDNAPVEKMKTLTSGEEGQRNTIADVQISGDYIITKTRHL